MKIKGRMIMHFTKLTLFFAFLILMISESRISAQTIPRLSCEDVRVIGFRALQEIMALTSLFVRERELAQISSNGILGANDRTYLNSESKQLLAEANRIVENVSYKDSYGDTHYYFNDGFKFTTIVRSKLAGDEFPKDFEIKPLRMKNLGKIAEKTFPIIFDESALSIRDNFTINGVAIPSPRSSDDQVSTIHNDYSAIAWKKMINSVSEQSGVTAKTTYTAAQFLKTPLNIPTQFQTWAEQDFVINGVSIIGRSRKETTNSILSAINDFSNLTGVKARLLSNEISKFELFSYDGRNIRLHISSRLLPVFGGQFKEDNFFIAPIRLLSEKSFELTVGQNAFLGFTGKQTVELTKDSVEQITITDQTSAENAVVHFRSAIDDLLLREASIGLIVDACPL
ncbi:MAG: flagellin [Bacteriovoracaceae bacterium]|nr:flagellin [Bacteriovoracaceae bacterium]